MKSVILADLFSHRFGESSTRSLKISHRTSKHDRTNFTENVYIRNNTYCETSDSVTVSVRNIPARYTLPCRSA